jgi:Uma2 family endonuclease
MPLVRKPPAVAMTLAEFLTWEPAVASVRSWQLIDGEPVAMAPGSDADGAIQAELAALLRNHLLNAGSPCRVATEPGIVPKLRANRNYRIPDIGVTSAPPTLNLMFPEPILLIEILSPSNDVETWANVWTYASIPSVAEILVVRSTRIAAEILRRDDSGQWPDEPTLLGPNDTISLTSIGFDAPLRSIYRTTVLASR